ncbi:MAG: potassium channel protein [Actinobacteria bacterium]|nr:potassium channel protein [Actinomycetota bacterium]
MVRSARGLRRYDNVVARPYRYRSANSQRMAKAMAAIVVVVIVGTMGYVALGITPLDALYQTVTTVTTIGFREVVHFNSAQMIYTIILALVGVGTVLYALTLTLELVMEGQLGNVWGRRRMQRDIDQLEGHAIVCGYGRVGRAAAEQLANNGMDVVVIDTDEARVEHCPLPHVIGDATDDDVLRAAGVLRAKTLVASLNDDPASVFAVLTARSINPELFVIARSRTDDAEAKFMRAGADRVVNPQRLGGNRIAAFADSPDVVDFLDVVMHEGRHEFRLSDIEVHAGSPLVGTRVSETRAEEGTGAILLALRSHAKFVTNPDPDRALDVGDVLIVVGTADQVEALHERAHAQ